MFFGGTNIFKKYMFILALRNSYETFRYAVLLSDGITWIRNIKEELILDPQ